MRILVFQHLEVEHPGVLREFWTRRGDTWRTVELDAGEPVPPLDDFDLLVAMGGPMDVWQEEAHPWLVPEKEAIRRWVEEMRRPYLGICLGHQLLACALGGAVGPMAGPEVGLVEVDLTPAGSADPLLAGFSPKVETFQWHGAEVTRLPEQAEILAGNAACAVQAMRWGRHAYGFQYHVEITSSTVAEWGAIPEYQVSLEQALGPELARGLGRLVEPRLSTFRGAAERLDENLTQIVTSSRATR